MEQHVHDAARRARVAAADLATLPRAAKDAALDAMAATVGAGTATTGGAGPTDGVAGSTAAPVRSIVFACDAGMGSSAMGASILRDKLKKAGRGDITVVNKAVANLEDDVDLVITQRELTDRARRHAPSARHVSVDNFLSSPVYDDVVRAAQAESQAETAERSTP